MNIQFLDYKSSALWHHQCQKPRHREQLTNCLARFLLDGWDDSYTYDPADPIPENARAYTLRILADIDRDGTLSFLWQVVSFPVNHNGEIIGDTPGSHDFNIGRHIAGAFINSGTDDDPRWGSHS